MNTNNSRFKLVALLAFAALAVYNVLVFVICGAKDHGASFWISYGFTLASFILVSVSVLALKNKSSKPKDALLDYPIFRHCIIYSVLSLVASVVFMLVDYFADIWIVTLLAEVALLGIYAVKIVSGFMAKEIIEETATTAKRNVQNMRLLLVDIEMIAERETDAEVKKAFLDFAEQARYSDPVSNPALEELENRISSLVKSVESIEDKQEKLNVCKEASLLLLERNKKTKALK